MSRKVKYKEKKILKASQEVYFMLFSLRDIFDRAAYDEKFDYKEAFSKLLVDENFLNRLARVRGILEEPFYDRSLYPDDGDISFLEQVYEDVILWKVKDKCIQKKN